jgi:hypothetical protein
MPSSVSPTARISAFVRRRAVLLVAGIVVIAALWLAFRPELLFVNKHVDDPFPTAHTTAQQLFVRTV